MFMATKTLTITEDAYHLLASRKSDEESFSEVIKKHFRKESLVVLAGILRPEEATELRRHIEQRRSMSRELKNKGGF
jgi:predicted CopG family antitoxin